MLRKPTQNVASNKQLLHLILDEKWDEARSMLHHSDNSDVLINETYVQGDNALFLAIWLQAPDDLIKSIINVSENAVFARNNDGEQPLHYAIYYGASYEVLLALIQANPAALDQHNVNGSTPRDYLSEGMLDERSNELVRMDTENILENMIRGRWGHSSRVVAEIISKMSNRVRSLEERASAAEFQAELLQLELVASINQNQGRFWSTPYR